jgi:hypothetical protein
VKFKHTILATLLPVLLLGAAPATAQETDAGAAIGRPPQALLSLGIGYFDVGKDESAADFRAEYRFANSLIWKIKPWAGVEATSDGGVWAGGGVLADFNLGNSWMLTPNFGVGGYAEGDGKDLGYGLEFRSQLELGYQFVDQSRVGVALSHISNASLGDKNPGEETLNLYYHIPVSWF